MNSSSSDRYLAMWCNEGIECLFNLTEWEKKKSWATLTGEKFVSEVPSLQTLMLRARYNVQREYEIYLFDSTVSRDELMEAFHENPQPLVDFIRENGDCLHSDKSKAKIRIE